MTREEQIADVHKRLCSLRPELASSPVTLGFVAVHVDNLRAFTDALLALGAEFTDAKVSALAHASLRYLASADVMTSVGGNITDALLASVGNSAAQN